MANNPQQHPLYTEYNTQVQLVNDMYNGSDSASKHLVPYQNEKDKDKAEFTERKKLVAPNNYVLRTVQSIKNIIFRKPISTTEITDKELLAWLENIDLKDTDINEFSKELLVNTVRDGIGYFLVDSPSKEDENMSLLEEKEKNIRPYFVPIKRQDLTFWLTDSFGNYRVIVFNESYELLTGDFGLEIKTQQKAIFNDGRVMIFRDGEKYQEYTREVKKITLVKIDDELVPPLYDMTKKNIEQMNRASEKSKYVRVGANPVPLMFGQLMEEDEATEITGGISSGFRFTNKTDCDFKWGEMSGANYKVIKEEIELLSKEMEDISISFATESNVKTATQVNKDSTEDESKLVDYATKLEDGINLGIEYMGEFRTTGDFSKQKVVANKDFDSNIITPEQFNMYKELRVNGDITYDRFMDLLERGELLPVLEQAERDKEKMDLRDEGNI